MNTYFTIYNATGEILRTGSCPTSDVDAQAGVDEFVIPVKADIEKDSVDVATKQIIPVGKVTPPTPPTPAPTYASSRKAMYPSTTEQLDMLWHSMDTGLTPKSQPFYDVINAIKTANPKPDNSVIVP